MAELKPCPFCGGEGIIKCYGSFYVTANHKKDCFLKPDTYLCSIDVSIKKQIKAWNRRST